MFWEIFPRQNLVANTEDFTFFPGKQIPNLQIYQLIWRALYLQDNFLACPSNPIFLSHVSLFQIPKSLLWKPMKKSTLRKIEIFPRRQKIASQLMQSSNRLCCIIKYLWPCPTLPTQKNRYVPSYPPKKQCKNRRVTWDNKDGDQLIYKLQLNTSRKHVYQSVCNIMIKNS